MASKHKNWNNAPQNTVSLYSILILTFTLNTSQLRVDAKATDNSHHSSHFNSVQIEDLFTNLSNLTQNHSLIVQPSLHILSDAHLHLKFKIQQSRSTHHSKQQTKQLNIIEKVLNFKLEPVKNRFIENNLTVSWHTNAMFDNHSVVEHREYFLTSNDNQIKFYHRLMMSKQKYHNSKNIDRQSQRSYSSMIMSKNYHNTSNNCQFFHGTILNNSKSFLLFNHSSSQPSFFTSFSPSSSSSSSPPFDATFSICEDGLLNGFVNWLPYGEIILQTNRHLECSSFWKKNKIFKKRNHFSYNTSSKKKLFKNMPEKLSLEDKKYSLIGCFHELKWLPIRLDDNQQIKTNTRPKRSISQERNIEILVVADRSMEEYHGTNLKSYLLTLMAGVAHIFEHSSIGNEINIRIVRMHIGKDDFAVWPSWGQGEEKGSAQTVLRRFCKWQRENNYDDDNDPRHHDTAILLTRRDLCRNSLPQNNIFSSKKGRTLCDTLGLAHSGRICDPDSSCAIIEDNGLSAAFTIAHELGHLLGVPHDDEEKCRNYYNTTEGQIERLKWNNLHRGYRESNVMARMIDFHSHMWSWSPCSKHFITEFLDSGYGDCLVDKNSGNQLEILNSMNQRRRSPQRNGEFLDPNVQCVLVYGRNSTVCTDMPTCRRLWCRTPQSLGCKTQHMPWAEGTECAPGKWCQEGECVTKTYVSPIDGGWGEWSEFSECSLPCGGGVRHSKRECINPTPKNGGRYCLGERARYESCNIEPCRVKSDVRAEQCSKYNGQNFNISGIESDVVWVPGYNEVHDNERCKLYCSDQVSGKSFMLQEKVIDGTPCSNDSFDICVNGHCKAAGCDGILHSDKQLDICGVCGGNNSTCDEIHGIYKPESVVHGYNKVLTIPAGAINIRILKDHSSTSSSDNWLAMKTFTGEYLLNGKFVVNMYRRKIDYAGTTLEYSGVRDQTTEIINSTRAITKKLIIELLCVGELIPPVIEYGYSIEKYRWMYVTSACNRICQGEMLYHSICVQTNSRNKIEKVSDKNCLRHSPKPEHKMKVCNLNCELKWEIEDIGKCSSKCGPGTKPRKIVCKRKWISKTYSGKDKSVNDSDCQQLVSAGKLEPKPLAFEACDGTECQAVHQWQTHTWERCDTGQNTCGNGLQIRKIDCLQSFQHDNGQVISEIVNPVLCSEPLPDMNRSCTVECPEWKIGSWSECSVIQCGISGLKYRSVECIHGNIVLKDEYCSRVSGIKPENRLTCMTPCPLTTTTTIAPTTAIITTTTTTTATTTTTSFPDLYFHKNRILSTPKYYDFIWVYSNWTSCNPLYKHLSSIEANSLKRHQVPECFNSTYGKLLFETNFKNLILINSIFVERSYEKLTTKLGINEIYLHRKRYVRCVERFTNREYIESYCDSDKKQILKEHCPIFDEYRPVLENLMIKNCSQNEKPPATTTKEYLVSNTPTESAITTTTKDIISNKASLPLATTANNITTMSTSIEVPDFVLQDSKSSKNESVSTSTLSNTKYDYISEFDNSSSIHSSFWHYSEWNNCKPKCDLISSYKSIKINHKNGLYIGYRQRKAECLNANWVQINDSYCDDDPVIEESCYSTVKCSNFVWINDHWSECSKQCGNGNQTRKVTCHRVNSHSFPIPDALMDDNCSTSKKPATIQSCNLGECPSDQGSMSFVWETLPWKSCSSLCGKGYQKRNVKCVEYHSRSRVEDAECNYKLKPKTSRTCNERPCSLLSCKDIQTRNPDADDGDYEIWIQNTKIKVYCKGMKTDKPIEYLKLPDNNENYSQFVKKNCDNEYTRLRTYYFSYVYLNLTSLQLIVSDASFNYYLNGNQKRFVSHSKATIGFGEAMVKGCVEYAKNNEFHKKNSSKCNYGNVPIYAKFSINLKNTGLAISPNQEWSKETQLDIEKNEYEKILGKCLIKINEKTSNGSQSNSRCYQLCSPTQKKLQLIVP